MTTAAAIDEEPGIIEMELEEPRVGWLTPPRARIAFIVLAAIAGIALLVAILAVVLAPATAVGLLMTALIVLAIVIILEVVLLLLTKPRKA